MKKIFKTLLLVIFVYTITINANALTLNCKYTYTSGSTGENVVVLQQILNKKMNCGLVEDGIFGGKTASCVRKYQETKDLLIDGVVGKATCASLNETNTQQTVNKPYLVSTSSVNFRSGPGTNYTSYGLLSPGTEVTVIEYTNSSWYKVSYNNKIGYIHTNYLSEKVVTPLASNEYIVLGSTINVRKGPSTSYSRLTTLKRGTRVKVTGTKGNWYKVSINNKTGYIRNDLITRNLIIVDISDQMLYYFKGDKNILTAKVVTGMKSRHDTPLGNYTLYTSSKETNRYLRGYNDDGSKYNAYVNYWMPFNGGVGFLDATWRGTAEFNKTQYKSDGSHGCVNMKLNDAKVLYTNTTSNTAVTVRQ